MKDTMVIFEVVSPYAQALMSVAKDQNLTQQFGEEAGKLIEILDSSQELTQFLSNPLVPAEAKKETIRQITSEDAVHPLMLNFLLLLVDRNRVIFLKEILAAYKALLREFNQTVLAEITSATELSEEQVEAVRQRVLRITGAQQVEFAIDIDPSLLGGLIVKVESQVIDASLRGQLRRIGMQLGAPVS